MTRREKRQDFLLPKSSPMSDQKGREAGLSSSDEFTVKRPERGRSRSFFLRRLQHCVTRRREKQDFLVPTTSTLSDQKGKEARLPSFEGLPVE